MPTKPRIAIIGAGPIGLEAALYARLKGYEVTVYERGRIAENIRQWGHVRMFSPFGMNSSEWGRGALGDENCVLPENDALLTGKELVETYLEPLSRNDALIDCCCWRTTVLSISRLHSRKTELIGDPKRAQEPFRLLVRRIEEDVEDTVPADVVLDCSGTYGNHNWLGAGGAPCPGELNSECDIRYTIPHPALTDVGKRWQEQEEFEQAIDSVRERLQERQFPPIGGHVGERTMVIGGGHSAATTVLALAQLRPVDNRTKVLWITRCTGDMPLSLMEDDRLPERDRLTRDANRLATSSSNVEWLGGYVVQRIRWNVDGHKAEVTLESVLDRQERTELVDNIIANVGYRPDRSLYEELQVHECYATQGPMRLAAKLLGETSADCLDQTSHGAEVLRNPEPNFYILGMKSYGRSSNFLIQVGLQQIVDVFSLVEQDWGL